MRSYFSIISLILLMPLSSVFAGNERCLMILLDPKSIEEKGNSTVVLDEFLIGIMQQCSSLIVSESIWNNFIKHRRKIETILAKEEEEYLQKLYSLWKQRKAIKNVTVSSDQAIKNIYKIFVRMQREIAIAAAQKGGGIQFNEQGEVKNIGKNVEKKLEISRNAIKEIVSKNVFLESDEDIRLSLACYLVSFNEKEWIIKVHDGLVILIPLRYYEQCKNSSTESFNKLAQQFVATTQGSLSREELMIGIKINHISNMDSLGEINQNDTSDFTLVKTLNDILITRSDLNLLKPKSVDAAAQEIYEQLLHPWYIYITGHGASNERIVGMPILSFKKVLRFFNFQIFTRFVFYDSCFAGGVSAENLFQYRRNKGPKITEDVIQPIQEEFNYTLASGTSLDASTLSPTVYFEELQIRFRSPKVIVIPSRKVEMRICRFFEQVAAYFGDSDVPVIENKISNIIDNIHPFKTAAVPDITYFQYYNTPMIRFAHTPWLFAEDVDRNVMHITPMMVKIATANQQPIIIKDKSIVFLAAPFISSIVIEGKMPKFLFALAGDSDIHITNVTVKVPKIDISNFVKAFIKLVDYPELYRKMCTIENLSFDAENDKMFRHVSISIRGDNYFAYAERLDGKAYILKKTEEAPDVKEQLLSKEQDEKQLLQIRELYKISRSQAFPDIEQKDIEQKLLTTYSAAPLSQFLQKRNEQLKRRQAEETRKKLLEKTWKQYTQKKQTPKSEKPGRLEIEELD